MNTEQFIQIQLELECIRIIEGNLLERMPCPNPDDIGLLSVYHDGEDYFVYYRDDVGSEIQEQTRNLPPKALFYDTKTIEDILVKLFPNTITRMFQTYLFPDDLNKEKVKEVDAIEQNGKSIFVIHQNEKIVSSCLSVRENTQAGECYVFTEPKYRGQGYGQQTTAAWGYHIQSTGKVPFYSHNQDNLASRALAKKIGLMPCFDVMSYGND